MNAHTCNQLSRIIGMSEQNMRYYLRLPDAPEPELRRKKYHFVKYYNLEEVREWITLRKKKP